MTEFPEDRGRETAPLCQMIPGFSDTQGFILPEILQGLHREEQLEAAE